MRRLWACFLLLCVGFTLPAVGGPVRICLAAMIPSALQERHCCCERDGEGKHDPCCVELERLPDGQQPAPQAEVPPVPVIDIGGMETWILRETSAPSVRADHPVASIRGPDPPSVRRAMLAIWRL